MKKVIFILMILLMTSICWAEESEPPADEPYEEALAVLLAGNDPNCINHCAIDKQMCINSCNFNDYNCKNRCSQSFGRCVSRCN